MPGTISAQVLTPRFVRFDVEGRFALVADCLRREDVDDALELSHRRGGPRLGLEPADGVALA